MAVLQQQRRVGREEARVVGVTGPHGKRGGDLHQVQAEGGEESERGGPADQSGERPIEGRSDPRASTGERRNPEAEPRRDRKPKDHRPAEGVDRERRDQVERRSAEIEVEQEPLDRLGDPPERDPPPPDEPDRLAEHGGRDRPDEERGRPEGVRRSGNGHRRTERSPA